MYRIQGHFFSRHHNVLIVAGGIFITAALSLVAMKDAGDDAYIVFRYVLRWLGGHGLTFNDGEFVEAFTSLTWTLLLAGLSYITGADVPRTALVANVVILVVTVVALDRAMRVAGASPTARAITVFTFSTAYVYFRVCFYGLELGLFGLLLTLYCAVMFQVLRNEEGPKPIGFTALGTLGGVLFATRPETLIILPATLVGLWLLCDVQWRQLARAATSYLAVVGVVEAWRRLYYHEWLPNSSAAKSILLGDPQLAETVERRLVEGLTYLYASYRLYPVLAVIVFTACVLAAARALRMRSVLLFIPIVWGNVVALENGGDWMPAYRLVTVYWPVYLLAGWSLATDVYARYGRRPVILLVGLALVLHLSASMRSFNEEAYIALRLETATGRPIVHWTNVSEVRGFAYVYETAARALKSAWVPGDIIASESVGILGYLAPDMYIHDPTGLADRTLAYDPIAAQSTFGRMNWRYSLSLKPAVVLLHWWPHQNLWSQYGVGYPSLFDRYCVRAPISVNPAVLYVIVRKDHPEYGRAIRHVGGQLLTVYADGTAHCPEPYHPDRPT